MAARNVSYQHLTPSQIGQTARDHRAIARASAGQRRSERTAPQRPAGAAGR